MTRLTAERPTNPTDAATQPSQESERRARPTPRFQRIPFTLADALLILGMCIWATHYSIAKAAIEVLPPFVFNVLRFSVALAAMAALVRFSGERATERVTLSRRDLRVLLALAITFYGLYQALFMNGLRHTTVAHSVLISTVAPAGVVLLNIALGRERGSRRIYSGILIALAGVLVVVISRFADEIAGGAAGTANAADSTLFGDLLSMGGVVVWVLGTNAQREVMRRTPLLAASFWLLVFGAGVALVVGLPDLLRFDWALITPPIALAVVYSGVVAVVVAGTIWNFGLKRLGASRTATYVNLQPIVAAAAAIVFLNEPFTVWLVVGTTLVLVGMWRLRLG